MKERFRKRIALILALVFMLSVAVGPVTAAPWEINDWTDFTNNPATPGAIELEEFDELDLAVPFSSTTDVVIWEGLSSHFPGWHGFSLRDHYTQYRKFDMTTIMSMVVPGTFFTADFAYGGAGVQGLRWPGDEAMGIWAPDGFNYDVIRYHLPTQFEVSEVTDLIFNPWGPTPGAIFERIIVNNVPVDTGLISVFNMPVDPVGEGTQASPYVYDINVPFSKMSILFEDILQARPFSSVELFSDPGFSLNRNQPVPLAAGDTTPVFIRITAVDDVTTAYYQINVTRSSTLSNENRVQSVLGENISWAGTGDTPGNARTASIDVPTTLLNIQRSNIALADGIGATFTLYSGGFGVTPANEINLPRGQATNVYIRVVAEDGTPGYHILTVNKPFYEHANLTGMGMRPVSATGGTGTASNPRTVTINGFHMDMVFSSANVHVSGYATVEMFNSDFSAVVPNIPVSSNATTEIDVNFRVTAEDGTTHNYYRVTIDRFLFDWPLINYPGGLSIEMGTTAIIDFEEIGMPGEVLGRGGHLVIDRVDGGRTAIWLRDDVGRFYSGIEHSGTIHWWYSNIIAASYFTAGLAAMGATPLTGIEIGSNGWSTFFGATLVDIPGPPPGLTDGQAVTEDSAALTWLAIRGLNTGTEDEVVLNLNLPAAGANDTTITWASNNPAVISNDGVVNRPPYLFGSDPAVILTATVSKGSATNQVVFNLTVLRAEPIMDDSDANLALVAGNTITTTGGSGTQGAPYLANITVPLATSRVVPADIIPNAYVANATLYATNAFENPVGAGGIDLNLEGDTDIFIRVVSGSGAVTRFYRVTVTHPNDPYAYLESVAGQDITVLDGTGTQASPFTANINVHSSVTAIIPADLATVTAGAVATLYSSGTFTPPVSEINLTAAGDTDIFVRVVSPYSLAARFYRITVTQAACDDTTILELGGRRIAAAQGGTAGTPRELTINGFHVPMDFSSANIAVPPNATVVLHNSIDFNNPVTSVHVDTQVTTAINLYVEVIAADGITSGYHVITINRSYYDIPLFRDDNGRPLHSATFYVIDLSHTGFYLHHNTLLQGRLIIDSVQAGGFQVVVYLRFNTGPDRQIYFDFGTEIPLSYIQTAIDEALAANPDSVLTGMVLRGNGARTLYGVNLIDIPAPPPNPLHADNILKLSPLTVMAGVTLPLDALVLPLTAPQDIVWSVYQQNGTDAVITLGNLLRVMDAPAFPAEITIRGTVPGGLGAGNDFTRDFTITITENQFIDLGVEYVRYQGYSGGNLQVFDPPPWALFVSDPANSGGSLPGLSYAHRIDFSFFDTAEYMVVAVANNVTPLQLQVHRSGNAHGTADTTAMLFGDATSIPGYVIFAISDLQDAVFAAHGQYMNNQNVLRFTRTSGPMVVRYISFFGPDIPIYGVEMDPPARSMIIGSSAPLRAELITNPLGLWTNNNEVTWTTSDAAVATVNSQGQVFAHGVGTATITVTAIYGNFTASSNITVVPETVTDLGATITRVLFDCRVTRLQAGATMNHWFYLRNTTDASMDFAYALKFDYNLICPLFTLTVEYENPQGVSLAVQNTLSGVWEMADTGLRTGAGNTVTFTYTDIREIVGQINGFPAFGVMYMLGGPDAIINRVTITYRGYVPVTGIDLAPSALTIPLNGHGQLLASVRPLNATNQEIIWSSSNEAVVTVDEYGVVTGHSPGDAIITATTASGSHEAVSTVTVTNQEHSHILPWQFFNEWAPGIPGGIPNVYQIYAVIDAATYGDGVVNATPAINAAIQAAGDAAAQTGIRQVVFLPAGVYQIDASSIRMNRSNVVLRGEGVGQTILRNYRYRGAGGVQAGILIGEVFPQYGSTPYVDLVESAAIGARSIQVADASGFNVGDILILDRFADDGGDRFGGSGGSEWITEFRFFIRGNYPANGPMSSDFRPVAQYIEIADIVGNTLYLANAININFSLAQRPQVWNTRASNYRFIGVEDLTMEWTNGNWWWNQSGLIFSRASSYSWVRNVVSYGGTHNGERSFSGAHVEVHGFRNTFRDSHVHGSRWRGVGGNAYGIRYHGTDLLIENNIVDMLNKPIVGVATGGGNVISHNFVPNAVGGTSWNTENGWQETAVNASHGAYAHSDLLEGNYAVNITTDTTWGNNGLIVYFRNHAWGRNLTAWSDGPHRAACVHGFNNDHASIGNVWLTPENAHFAPYMLGYFAQAFPGADSQGHDGGHAAARFHRHLDFTYNAAYYGLFNNPDNQVSALPNSLFRTAAPAFFDGYTWPPVNPHESTTAGRVSGLPAQSRYTGFINPAAAKSITVPSIVVVEAGETEEITVTLTGIANGEYRVHLFGHPTGVTAGNITVDGNEGTFNLTAASTAAEGTFFVTIMVNGVKSNTFMLEVEEAEECDILWGDVNWDEEVDLTDLMWLDVYLSMQEMGMGGFPINRPASDVNNDGEIDRYDFNLLMMYLLGWDVVLGPQPTPPGSIAGNIGFGVSGVAATATQETGEPLGEQLNAVLTNAEQARIGARPSPMDGEIGIVPFSDPPVNAWLVYVPNANPDYITVELWLDSTANGLGAGIISVTAGTGSELVTWEVNPAILSTPAPPVTLGVPGTFQASGVESVSLGSNDATALLMGIMGTPPSGMGLVQVDVFENARIGTATFRLPTGETTTNFTISGTGLIGGADFVFPAGPVPATPRELIVTSLPPTITSAATASFASGTGGSHPLTATPAGPGTNPISFSVSGANLPAGVTVSGSNLEVGPEVAAGQHTFTVIARNIKGESAPQTFTLVVTAPATITGPTSATLIVGYAATDTTAQTGTAFVITGHPTVTVTIAVTPAASQITWSAAQSRLDIAAGLTVGDYEVVLTASNGIGTAVTHIFTLTVDNAPAAPTITGPTTMSLVAGYAATYTTAFTINLGTPAATVTRVSDPGITWNVAESRWDIAAGLAVGDHTATTTATNSAGTATHTFTLTVTEAGAVEIPPTITGGQLTMTLEEGYTATYTATFTINPGDPAATFTQTSSTPLITWNNATNRWNIAEGLAVGPHTATLTLTAANPANTVTHIFTLTVTEAGVVIVPPTITGQGSLTRTVGYPAFSTDAFTIEGTQPITVTPSNTHGDRITWNAITNRLDIAAGLPAGVYAVVLTATNAAGSDTHTFTLTVNPATQPPPQQTPTPPQATPRPPQATPTPTPAPEVATPSPTPIADTRLVITVPEQEHALDESEDIVVEVDDILTITFPLEVIEYLTADGTDIEDIYLYITISQPEAGGEGPELLIEIEMVRVGESITEVEPALIFEVNLSSFDLEDVIDDFNPLKVIAELEDGTLVRGVFDPETGIFTFETAIIGSFSIIYAPTLRVIGLEIGSYDIMELIYDELLIVMDVVPVIQSNRTLIPLRFVAYVLDASVYWNPDAREVTITRNGQTLTFAIGEMAPGMDVPAQIMNNRTMVPLRFIAEFFDATVVWIEETRSIEIITR